MVKIILISLTIGIVASILKSIIKSNRYRKKTNRKYYRNIKYSKITGSKITENKENQNCSDYKNIKFNEDYDSLAKNEQKLEKMKQEYNQHYEQKVKLYENLKKVDKYVEKGKNYELQIMKFYQDKSYRVFPNGMNKGKKDAGIDLIAWKDDEVVLIQCKNHKKEIQQDQIRKFIGDCYLYENKNKDITKNKKIKRDFVSNSSADYGSKMFLNENQGIVNFLNIKANFSSI